MSPVGNAPEALLARFSAPEAQRYSELMLSSLLTQLAGLHGDARVLDAWPEGEWAYAILFRQGGPERLGLRWSALAQTPDGRCLINADPFPPPVADGARIDAQWMAEELGSELKSLVADEDGVLWSGGTDPPPPDPPRDQFGINLTDSDRAAVRSRIAELDIQLFAFRHAAQVAGIRRSQASHADQARRIAAVLRLPVDQIGPIFELPAERWRDEDQARIESERAWLISWLPSDHAAPA